MHYRLGNCMLLTTFLFGTHLLPFVWPYTTSTNVVTICITCPNLMIMILSVCWVRKRIDSTILCLSRDPSTFCLGSTNVMWKKDEIGQHFLWWPKNWWPLHRLSIYSVQIDLLWELLAFMPFFDKDIKFDCEMTKGLSMFGYISSVSRSKSI